MTDLPEFLLARIAQRRARFTPGTVIVSGGQPAPEVPNCIGPTGTGCPEQWRLPAESASGWWRRPEVQRLMREHEMTHATTEQRFVLAECEAKRRTVEQYAMSGAAERKAVRLDAQGHRHGQRLRDSRSAEAHAWWSAVRLLALPYADHPDYREEWRP